MGRPRVRRLGVTPVYKRVDSRRRYPSFAYRISDPRRHRDEVGTGDGAKRLIVLGGGPNHIGPGIEFDYCCVRGDGAARARHETVMVNSDPETVSTDFDTSDFQAADARGRDERRRPRHHTASSCSSAVRRRSTSRGLRPRRAARRHDVDSIEAAEGRELMSADQSASTSHRTAGHLGSTGVTVADRVGYPVLVRPACSAARWRSSTTAMAHSYMERHQRSPRSARCSSTVPRCRDRGRRGRDRRRQGRDRRIMEPSKRPASTGRSSCAPPYTLSDGLIDEICSKTRLLAKELRRRPWAYGGPCGPKVYILETNPRRARCGSSQGGRPAARQIRRALDARRDLARSA